MMNRILLSVFIFVACALSACKTQQNSNETSGKHLFNNQWKFTVGDVAGAEMPGFDDSSWRVLDLPHDWSIEGKFSKDNPMTDRCGYLPAGIGWYRKTITVPDSWKGKHVEIAFDGVYMNSTVWANGQQLGFRPYGWVSFAYDISSIVAASDKITFAVRVDNSKQPSARWYTGSGIYANVWLDVRNPMHIDREATFIQSKSNKLLIETAVKVPGSGEQPGELVFTVLDANGKKVSSAVAQPNEKNRAKVEMMITDAYFWDVDHPYLYTLITELKRQGEILDRVEQRVGLRDIQWVPETGMWLNGKNVKVRGVCNHQDAGALGAAVPDKILRYRLQMLKDMGCNAIRTAHNAQTPQFYDMCDEMGILVMDEFFDGWEKKAEFDYGAQAFAEWWRRDLTDLILRDRNHPSVVIYSVGNETRGDVGKELVELCHQLDPTRPVTSGYSASEYMDVLGVNGASEGKDFFDTLDTRGRVFIGTENPHTWHNRGFYRTKMWYRDGYPGKNGQAHKYPDLTEEEIFTYDWTDGSHRTNSRQTLRSDYDNSTISLVVRHSIQKLRDIPFYAGTFRWTGFDYIGEAKYHGGWPFFAFSGGAIDLANFPKDLYYLYQSQWTEKPMVHILPHWTHPTMKEGTKIPVWVYSNCDEVELLFNGKSLGKDKPGKQWQDMQCEWMVPYHPGELIAIGYKHGEEVVRQSVRTAGPPAKFKLSVDGEPLSKLKNDIVQVRVTTIDEDGNFYPYGENRTYFHVMGPAEIQALDNGSPLDTQAYFRAESRKAFFGLTRAYVKSTAADGNIALLAGGILGEKKLVTSKQVSIYTDWLTLRGKYSNQQPEIFYTTDGSRPTVNSTKYEQPFEIELGTIVKALVMLNGEQVFLMEERFAKDEGFYWENVVNAEGLGGDQAEDAKFRGGVKQHQGKGFHGTGYLEFGPDSNGSGFVEWYYENDRGAGGFKLQIRYSASAYILKEHQVMLVVNGKEQPLALKSSQAYRREWNTYTVGARLQAGANYIRLKIINTNALAIDELNVE